MIPAWERARAAIERHPKKSDRAIAKEIGVSAPTVGKARPPTVNSFTVEKRIGLDGRERRLPNPAPKRVRQNIVENAQDLIRSYIKDMNRLQREQFFRWLRKEYRL